MCGLDGYAGVAQLVELQFSKLNVASSSLVARSKRLSLQDVNLKRHGFKKTLTLKDKRPCGSVVEHSLGKGEVAGPIPAMGTMTDLTGLFSRVVVRSCCE